MHTKIFLVWIGVLLLLLSPFTIYGDEKTDEELLRETELLAVDIKEFGKSIGISPSRALEKIQKESQTHTLLSLGLKKQGVVTPAYDIELQFIFSGGPIGVKWAWLTDIVRAGYSYYVRLITEYSGNNDAAVITLDFAKEALTRKVEVILHEDLHENIQITGAVEESVVTPLAYLAALKFFEHGGDAESIQEVKRLVEERRAVSKELNKLAEEATKTFEGLPLKKARERIFDSIPSHPTYQKYFGYKEGSRDLLEQLEAKISHDLAYYTHFDRIIGLYEKAGDLKALIEDFKNSPRDGNELAKYLDGLEKKYERHTP